jgi:hypothetical protein
LLEGIRAKDAEATRAAMYEHITHAGELLAEHFDRRVAAGSDEESPSDGSTASDFAPVG